MAPDPLRLVLRLLHEPAAAGLVVGHVEIVHTGEVVTVRSANDLVDLVRRLATAPT